MTEQDLSLEAAPTPGEPPPQFPGLTPWALITPNKDPWFRIWVARHVDYEGQSPAGLKFAAGYAASVPAITVSLDGRTLASAGHTYWAQAMEAATRQAAVELDALRDRHKIAHQRAAELLYAVERKYEPVTTPKVVQTDASPAAVSRNSEEHKPIRSESLSAEDRRRLDRLNSPFLQEDEDRRVEKAIGKYRYRPDGEDTQ